LTIVLDSQSPVVKLLAPVDKSFVDHVAGYVELQWSDPGAAGLDVSTVDAADVTVSGVSIDRVEHRGGGLVRYWYNDDGQSLAVGKVEITVALGAVADLAGNANVASATFWVGVYDSWNNPVCSYDVNGDTYVTALDVLIVINHINVHGAGPLSGLPVLIGGRPAFLDVDGNDYVLPLDVLRVINYINVHGPGPIPEGELSGVAKAANGSDVRGADQGAQTGSSSIDELSSCTDLEEALGDIAEDIADAWDRCLEPGFQGAQVARR
jgi:hypothetical protein